MHVNILWHACITHYIPQIFSSSQSIPFTFFPTQHEKKNTINIHCNNFYLIYVISDGSDESENKVRGVY